MKLRTPISDDTSDSDDYSDKEENPDEPPSKRKCAVIRPGPRSDKKKAKTNDLLLAAINRLVDYTVGNSGVDNPPAAAAAAVVPAAVTKHMVMKAFHDDLGNRYEAAERMAIKRWLFSDPALMNEFMLYDAEEKYVMVNTYFRPASSSSAST